ncbi:MAG: GNAT family N-acetyltransferase [Clostridia bacterium]|nr:GNAT family N-acetyltransferase [Clostridia bacterium]
MNYIIKKEINVEDFLRLREELGWKNLSKKQLTKAISGSMINLSIFKDNECVGIGRVVGDNALKGMLTDIMVSRKYQKQGIGKLIVTTLIDDIEKILEEGEQFQLEASPTEGNRDFYIKCGMKYKPENQDGVYLWIKK